MLFAGNETQRAYITATFAGINTIHLEGYNVRYASSGFMFMPAIASQLPGLLQAIKQEHSWLEGVVNEHRIDAVISDNRYGLYHKDIPCVIMTHQLQVMSGMGSIADKAMRIIHYKYLDKFSECWVVDAQEANGLAGKLSHPAVLPERCSYIGLLSQIQDIKPVDKGYLLVLLSGPEPQRTILSDKIWEQIQDYDGQVIFAEGSNSAIAKTNIPAHITYYKQLIKDELEQTLSGANIIICRSGYSTLMDLVKLNKKAILIPTPGQTEQEYLAQHLEEQGIFLCMTQSKFNLHKAIQYAKRFPFSDTDFQMSFDVFQVVLDKWLSKHRGS